MDPVPQTSSGRFPIRFLAYLVLGAILMALSVCALASVLIRSVDSLLLAAGEPDFAEIFAQLETADLDTHGVIPFVLALLFLLAIGLLFRKIRWWTVIPAIPLGIVLFALSLAASVWFTDVNGIRVGTVVRSLADLLEAGIF